jgi:hypothetical protein
LFSHASNREVSNGGIFLPLSTKTSGKETSSHPLSSCLLLKTMRFYFIQSLQMLTLTQIEPIKTNSPYLITLTTKKMQITGKKSLGWAVN